MLEWSSICNECKEPFFANLENSLLCDITDVIRTFASQSDDRIGIEKSRISKTWSGKTILQALSNNLGLPSASLEALASSRVRPQGTGSAKVWAGKVSEALKSGEHMMARLLEC